MRPEYYVAILERLQKEFGLTMDRTEHNYVTEFMEGPIPQFKLIMSTAEQDNPSILIISFHIELDSPTAIQWYLRVRGLDPNLHISASYIKDAEGTSYVGEDAEIMRAHMYQQDILSGWAASDLTPEEVLEAKPQIPEPSPIKQYSDYRKALIAFHRLKKSKKDIAH